MTFSKSNLAAALALALCGATPGISQAGTASNFFDSLALFRPGANARMFERIATLPVYRNTDASQTSVAEIIDATKDGRTLVYTDSPGKRIGFIDIANPFDPKVDGVLPVGGEPTSVAIAPRYALVGVNTSASFTSPSGKLAVVDLNTRAIVAELDMQGQPDSVTLSPDGRYAAVAVENERDEDVNDGDLPQEPSGHLMIVDIKGLPGAWQTRKVDLTGLAGIAPDDAEPEYVDINRRNIAAVTLQENNHLVFVNLRDGSILNHYPMGTVDLDQIDTVEDDVIRLTGSLAGVRREADAITWIDDMHVATANEGDWKGGSRGWSVFNMMSGLVHDAGNSYEHIAVRHGHYPESRSENKGSEPEGVDFGQYGRDGFLFVGSERGNFVAVYKTTRNAEPKFLQLLPTTASPEGLKALPQRNLFIVSTELDDADLGLRASVNIYRLKLGAASYPTIVSGNDPAGNPIPWGALSALVGDKDNAKLLYGAHDSYYKEPKLYTIDASTKPARITSTMPLTNCNTCDYDIEGLAQRADGGFWLASEGNNSRKNLLIRATAAGVVQQEIPLPPSLDAQKTTNGFEGVAVVGSGDGERVYVAFQREWKDDPQGHVKLGRYTPSTGDWAFYRYPLDPVASPAGGWVGLSELTYLGNDRFAVIERDNQRGDNAALKKLYTFSVAGITPAAHGGTLPELVKQPALDLLPVLQQPKGWVQDKPEGLALSAGGRVYMVTDNDGVDESTGETQFRDLGPRRRVFGF